LSWKVHFRLYISRSTSKTSIDTQKLLWLHSHTPLILQTVTLDVEVNGMPENKKKVEDAAEKTGEAVGKGVKKGAKAVSDFGKGVKKELKKKE